MTVESIYLIDLEITDTTETDTEIETVKRASYFDLHLEIGDETWLKRNLYYTRDEFSFQNVNFSFSVRALHMWHISPYILIRQALTNVNY